LHETAHPLQKVGDGDLGRIAKVVLQRPKGFVKGVVGDRTIIIIIVVIIVAF
jgi:hypothetical protein